MPRDDANDPPIPLYVWPAKPRPGRARAARATRDPDAPLMAAEVRARGSREVFGAWLVFALLAPTAVLFLAGFGYPIGLLLSEGFFVKGTFSLENFSRVLDRPLYVATLLRTLRVGGLTTLICLLIGFPLAYWMTRLRGLAFNLVIACVLLPLWTSILVRSYAWVVLLQPTGLVNKALMALGITDAPVTLLYTEGAVITAMAHVLLPYMVLPIYSALNNIPPNLGRAARSLGAGRLTEFFTIILPLSRVGVVAGCVMVFVLSIGFFVTPALLGGPRTLMISTLINQQISSLLNWSFGGALGATLLVVTLAILLLFNRAISASRRSQ